MLSFEKSIFRTIIKINFHRIIVIQYLQTGRKMGFQDDKKKIYLISGGRGRDTLSVELKFPSAIYELFLYRIGNPVECLFRPRPETGTGNSLINNKAISNFGE